MFREITLGQYYPAVSVLHSLDPRVKLFGTLIYIIVLFIADNPISIGVITAALIAVIVMSHVPFSYMTKGLRGIVTLLIIAGLFNLFMTQGTPILTIGRFSITDVGLKNAVIMVVRMVYLIIGTSLMTLTTTPNQLTDGLERSLKPMSKIGVPVHEISMMMSIALRFIPILVEETDKIMKAQMARGADFESGGLIKRARAMVPILVPLFVSAFRRASDLAMAMEARCYHGGEGRTKMKPLSYTRTDRLAYLIILTFLAVIIALAVLL